MRHLVALRGQPRDAGTAQNGVEQHQALDGRADGRWLPKAAVRLADRLRRALDGGRGRSARAGARRRTPWPACGRPALAKKSRGLLPVRDAARTRSSGGSMQTPECSITVTRNRACRSVNP